MWWYCQVRKTFICLEPMATGGAVPMLSSSLWFWWFGRNIWNVLYIDLVTATAAAPLCLFKTCRPEWLHKLWELGTCSAASFGQVKRPTPIPWHCLPRSVTSWAGALQQLHCWPSRSSSARPNDHRLRPSLNLPSNRGSRCVKSHLNEAFWNSELSFFKHSSDLSGKILKGSAQNAVSARRQAPPPGLENYEEQQKGYEEGPHIPANWTHARTDRHTYIHTQQIQVNQLTIIHQYDRLSC